MPANPPLPSREESTHWPRVVLLAVLLVGVAGAAYAPVGRAGFIWDDDSFLTANALIRASDGLGRFWTTTQAPDYWPVTSTSLWLEWRWWGLQAAGYHWTNLGLHLGDCLLLWGVLRRLRLPGAYLAALLFAVHPVNVESVAWIAQRKNLMAMLFYLASIHCFLGADGPATTLARRCWYALSLGAFACGMLSKGSVATLPAVLALVLWWQGRWSLRELRRLVPFALIAAVFAGIDVWFQHLGAADPIRRAGFVERLLGAPAVVEFYLAKALWPHPLIFVYPEWRIQPADLLWWLPLAGAIGLTAILWRRRRDWGRPWFFAWTYFCATLVPVLGFTDVYFMKYSLVADHYQHLALIGVVALAAAGWAHWQRRQGGIWPPIAAGLVVALLATLTFRQCRTYRDSETLYRSILEKDPGSWFAHYNLGILIARQGHPETAGEQFAQALRTKPEFADAEVNWGDARLQTGDLPGAIAHFRRAVAMAPRDHQARYDLGLALAQSGLLPEAIVAFSETLQLDPDFSDAHDNLGIALARAGQLPEALVQLKEAVRLKPGDFSARQNLAIVLRAAGQPAEANAQFEIAARLQNGNPSPGK